MTFFEWFSLWICTLSHLVKLEILQPKSLKKFNAFFIRCTAQLLLTNELFRIWLNCKIECLGEKKWPDALCANGQCHAHYSDIFDKTPYSKFLNYIRRFKAKSFVASYSALKSYGKRKLVKLAFLWYCWPLTIIYYFSRSNWDKISQLLVAEKIVNWLSRLFISLQHWKKILVL